MVDGLPAPLLDALGRAATVPEGAPLFGGKSAPGLFPPSAAAKSLAQRCKDEGLLRLVRTESRGKTTHEICAITEKGMACFLDQAGPQVAIEALLRDLESRGVAVGGLLDEVRRTRENLDSLRAVAEKILERLRKPPAAPAPATNGSETWPGVALRFLKQWQDRGAVGDCALPELYRQSRQAAATLSIGEFHDGLRLLHEREQIYLHPWTGPLYDLPQPELALLVGHEVAYYASVRA